MTTVVNKHKSKYTVYIGRGSKWGNPFVIGEDGTRAEVIQMYEDYLRRKPDLLAQLPELEGEILGCFCKPAACHGDVLIKLLEELHGKC
jgi:hypothetical protein